MARPLRPPSATFDDTSAATRYSPATLGVNTPVAGLYAPCVSVTLLFKIMVVQTPAETVWVLVSFASTTIGAAKFGAAPPVPPDAPVPPVPPAPPAAPDAPIAPVPPVPPVPPAPP